MRILSLVLGALLIITGVGLYVIETGVESNKSNTYIVIIAHLSIIIGGVLLTIGKLKKRI